MEFVVMRIEGEYAYLRRSDACSMGEDFMVAMALLPPEADFLSRIWFEDGEYTLVRA